MVISGIILFFFYKLARLNGIPIVLIIMGILNNGMSLMSLTTDIQKVVKGLVLLGAVTVDVLSKRKKS